MERIGIVGAGRAGGALARALAAVGWPVVAVSSRTPASAARLVAHLPAARALPTAQAVADAADLVFLAVPNAAIADVAASVGWHPGQAVAHLSGADSLAPLAAAARAGALAGSFHPLQTFAAPVPDPLAPFAGITCALEGDPALLPRLEAVAVALGARPLRLPPEAKALYHASAALAANYLVTLLHLAADLWQPFGVSEADATAALLPLVRGAVENVATHGAARALTGPIARGDQTTVARHLAALAAARPDTLATYQALARATVALAQRHGSLDPAAAQSLLLLLDTPAVLDALPPAPTVRANDEPSPATVSDPTLVAERLRLAACDREAFEAADSPDAGAPAAGESTAAPPAGRPAPPPACRYSLAARPGTHRKCVVGDYAEP